MYVYDSSVARIRDGGAFTVFLLSFERLQNRNSQPRQTDGIKNVLFFTVSIVMTPTLAESKSNKNF